MLDFTQADLKAVAERLLALEPDPVPRFRLLRDVLKLDPEDAAYRKAERGLQDSRWIALLQGSQLPDGTWGRFHTQDTKVKQPFPTTERAVAAALDSGLDGRSPLLQKTVATLLGYMEGVTCWPDPPEKHDNPAAWYVWVPQVSAAVLSSVDRYHPRLDAFWRIWAETVRAAFSAGAYDRRREIAALNDLLQCRMGNPIPFHKKYPLLLLSATRNRLPSGLERTLLDFVLHHPAGIYYVYDREISALPPVSSRGFWAWTRAHALLSRFHAWRELSGEAVNWIWAQRTADGFWDLGGRIARKPFTCFPLSEFWRRPENRIIDGSVEMLALLARCFGD